MNQESHERDAYVLFELAGATYALRSEEIQQLEMIGVVTPVPNAAPYVEGVVSVRGQVIPAIDLRARFGFPRADRTPRSRLLIVRVEDRRVGLLVDSAREFTRIPAESIQPPPDAVGGTSGRYLRGIAHVGERLVLVLDPAELLIEAEESTPAGAAHAGS